MYEHIEKSSILVLPITPNTSPTILKYKDSVFRQNMDTREVTVFTHFTNTVTWKITSQKININTSFKAKKINYGKQIIQMS